MPKVRLSGPKFSPARRFVRLVCQLALACLLAAPMLLGPAMTPVMRALGAHVEHACACGMPAGQCGCPECDRLEEARLDEHATRSVPVLKSDCEDAPSVPVFAPLPPVAPLARAIAVVSTPREPTPTLLPGALASADPARPPTPPPRRAS